MRYQITAHAEVRRNKAIQILGYVAQGHNIREASKMIFVAPRSGEKYLNDLRAELNAISVTHLVYIALKQGIIN